MRFRAGDVWPRGSAVVAATLALAATLSFAAIPAKNAIAAGSKSAPVCDAANYQETATHTGFSCTSLPKLPRRLWSRHLDGAVSYPLIANGQVFVTTARSLLYAFSDSSGRISWGPVALPTTGSHNGAELAYDHHRLFVDDQNGDLQAFDSRTGRQLWTDPLQNYAIPVTANGFVYAAGYQVRETNGDVLRESYGIGDPAVTKSAVFFTAGCYGVRFTLTHRTVWQHETGCSGGPPQTAYVAGNEMYASGTSSVYNAGSGRKLRNFVGLPELGTHDDVLLNGTTLTAHQRSPWKNQWKSTLPAAGVFGAPPVATATAIYVLTETGRIDVIHPNSGKAIGSLKLPTKATMDAYATTGLAIGNHLLAAPAGNSLTVFG